MDYFDKDRLIVCRRRLEYFDKGRLNCFDIEMSRSFHIKMLDCLTKDRLIVCRGRLEYFDKGRLNCFTEKYRDLFTVDVGIFCQRKVELF